MHFITFQIKKTERIFKNNFQLLNLSMICSTLFVPMSEQSVNFSFHFLLALSSNLGDPGAKPPKLSIFLELQTSEALTEHDISLFKMADMLILLHENTSYFIFPSLKPQGAVASAPWNAPPAWCFPCFPIQGRSHNSTFKSTFSRLLSNIW